jgi:hypothetical protein
MKRVFAGIAVILFAAGVVWAAAPKSYQVTGPVLDVKEDVVVVEKDNEKWEIARDKETKVSGDLKVGSRVTIMYRMKAGSIEVKEAPKKAETKKEEKKKAPAKK